MVTVCSSLATLYLPQLTVTLACCCVLGCLVTSVSLELHSTLKYLKKEIYLRQPDRKVPEIDGIWNLLRFPICSSLKLIKHSLLAGVTPFFIIRILAAKNISIYSPVFMLYARLPLWTCTEMDLGSYHHTALALYICSCRCRMYPGVGGGSVVSVCVPVCHSNSAHKQLQCFHLATANNAHKHLICISNSNRKR